MAYQQAITDIISCKPPWLGWQARARSLAAALILGAGIASSAVAAAVSSAAAQEVEWATSASGAGNNVGLGIATDPGGNSYVTGYSSGPARFGAGEANETVLEAGDSTTFFVAKYARDATLLWATSAVGAPFAVGSDIATSPGGDSYVTGYFHGTATFGVGEANETVLEAVADSDIFVAKYAADGSLLWVTSAGGASVDIGFGIATDPIGNSYVTGYFTDTASFGAGEANETALHAVEAGEHFAGFVATYARDGTLLWARSAATGDFSTAIGIATDPRGNSYVIGSFEGTTTFGAGEVNETVLEAVADSDMFVAKYAPDGAFLWATSAGGAGGSFGFSLGIAMDRPGNSYVTGNFHGTATFGAGEANETVLEAVADSDIFVAKYARDGTLQWATSAGGVAGETGGHDVATDPLDNSSYVTGYFSGTVTFGAGEANETVLEAEASSDVFVAKYHP
jgi:hypothetical protein